MLSHIERIVAENDQKGVQQDFTQRIFTIQSDELIHDSPKTDPNQDCVDCFLQVVTKCGLHLSID